MQPLPTSESDLSSRARWTALAGWLTIALSGFAALLPLVERRGGALVIGALLVIAGVIETAAGTLRHESKFWAMLAGIVTILAGVLFAAGPATEYFLPSVAIVMVWLVARAVILFAASRLAGGGVRWWTTLSAATDLVLALLLLVGFQVAALIVSLFGATAPLVASFAWIVALSLVTNGLMLLEVASCARAQEDV